MSKSKAREKLNRAMITVPLKVSPLESCPRPGKHAAFLGCLNPNLSVVVCTVSHVHLVASMRLDVSYRRQRQRLESFFANFPTFIGGLQALFSGNQPGVFAENCGTAHHRTGKLWQLYRVRSPQSRPD